MFPNKANFPATESRDTLYLEDFSENLSLLFPSALDTFAEEDSSRYVRRGTFDSQRLSVRQQSHQ
jgi:hypothetical protein